MSVPGRAVDGHTPVHELLAGGVDVVHLVGQVPEIPATGVLLGIPVVGQLHHRRHFLPGLFHVIPGGEEHQGESSGLVVVTAGFHHVEAVPEEADGFIQVADPDHGMQVSHLAVSGRVQ